MLPLFTQRKSTVLFKRDLNHHTELSVSKQTLRQLNCIIYNTGTTAEYRE